jgi:hypothetical protein
MRGGYPAFEVLAWRLPGGLRHDGNRILGLSLKWMLFAREAACRCVTKERAGLSE